MLLVPVPETMTRTARVLANVRWGGGRGRFEKRCRFIAESAEAVPEGARVRPLLRPGA